MNADPAAAAAAAQGWSADGCAPQFSFPLDAGRGRPVSTDESSMLISSGDASSTGLGTDAPSRHISRIAWLIELAGKAGAGSRTLC